MKRRVFPYGMGKYLIEINMNELPEDIQKGLKELYKNKLKNSEKILILGQVESPKDK